MDSWQERAIAATRGNQSQLGTILLCALKRPADGVPTFHGKASITSDGFVMCDFTGRDGQYHHGAFIGSASDLEGNVRGLARHLALSDADRHELFHAVRDWIATDYSNTRLLLDA